MNGDSLSSRGRPLFYALLFYLVIGLLLLTFYRYQLNVDGISYISIAQKYAAGDIRNAINGYWGPLISWLLVPFLLVGVNPLIATKLLSLCVGFLTIIGFWRLCFQFEMTNNIRRAVLFALVPIVMMFALWSFTPDLLLTCILLYYFSIIFRADYADRASKGALCGAIGAMAYLAKSYAFGFFLVHFVSFSALHYLSADTRRKKYTVLRGFLLGSVLFCLLVAPWAYVISRKYEKLTIGMAGRYSWQVVGPESQGQAVLWLGLLEPPNETAISAWEDPSYINMVPWSPFASWNSFLYELRLIARNLYSIVVVCESFSVFFAAILLGYILICVMPPKRLLFRRDALYPPLTILLYGAGYIVFLIETRYLWVIYVLLLPMGGHLLYRLFKNDFFNPTRRTVALSLFLLSFVAVPVAQLVRDMNVGKDVYDMSRKVQKIGDLDGRFASDSDWRKSVYLAYHLNVPYYGIPRPGTSQIDFQNELKKNDIDYLLVWNDEKAPLRFLSTYEEVTGGKVPGLRIYHLGKPGAT